MGQLSKSKIKQLDRRRSILYHSSNVARGVWNELERFVVPYRGRMFTTETSEGSVQWDKYNHYDDTAVISHQILCSSIHGAVLPRLRWFDLKFRDKDLNDHNEASEWLADSTRRAYLTIDQSNFDLEADELILDLGGFGHGFMVAEGEDEKSFDSVPIKEAVFDEDENGVPMHFFRTLHWTPSKIVSKFGYENCPETVQKAYDNPGSTDDRIKVIFAIFPRLDKKDADITKPLTAEERPFGFQYYLENGFNPLGEEGGYYDQPVYSVRWRKVSGSQWGHGPGHVCLGDIRQLNQHRLMRTRAIEKAIDPANITTERGLLSNLDLGPRGLTVLRDIDALKPYEGRANFQISAEELVLLQQSIRSAFRVDQLQMKESPAMTATEVQVRYELMQRLLGPTLGRIRVDWLDRVVESTFNSELRNGKFLDIPDVLRDQDIEIEIEYIGAMATAQKATLAAELTQYAGDMAQLSQFYPKLKYTINDDELGRTIGQLKNIPENVINGKDAADQAYQEDKELIAQQQAAMQQQQEGEAMKAQGEGQAAMQAVE